MPKAPANKLVAREAIYNARALRKHTDRLWNRASEAPMFSKELNRDKNGKVLRRSARLIGGHAYCIAASGAMQAVSRQMRSDCTHLGIPYERSTDAAALPAFAKGACRLVEQFLAAYVQEAILVANRTMMDLGKKKRLDKQTVRAAFAEVNESIFSSSGPAARTTVVVPLAKKASKGQDEEDYTAADGEGDEAADEAVVAAGGA